MINAEVARPSYSLWSERAGPWDLYTGVLLWYFYWEVDVGAHGLGFMASLVLYNRYSAPL
jgi:hypothetical protein